VSIVVKGSPRLTGKGWVLSYRDIRQSGVAGQLEKTKKENVKEAQKERGQKG